MSEPQFTVATDGFVGKLFKPARDAFSSKAMIVFTGSDGRFQAACRMAQTFNAVGMTALALAYVRQKGLPDGFREVPVEAVEKAAFRLQTLGYIKIGLWGISMGGELALLAAVRLPKLVSCVVAVNPMAVATQGFQGLKALPCAAFSWRDAPIAYQPFAVARFPLGKVAHRLITKHDYGLPEINANLLDNPREDAIIPVENIRGPILCLTSLHDHMWPSSAAGDFILRRLTEKGFPYPCRHQTYEFGSHMLAPIPLALDSWFYPYREHPEECRAAKRDSWEKTVAFLQEW